MTSPVHYSRKFELLRLAILEFEDLPEFEPYSRLLRLLYTDMKAKLQDVMATNEAQRALEETFHAE